MTMMSQDKLKTVRDQSTTMKNGTKLSHKKVISDPQHVKNVKRCKFKETNIQKVRRFFHLFHQKE